MLEKLLEEIEEKIRLKRTVWDSLEKPPYNDFEQSLWIAGMRNAKEIIRKHMNGDWIPVKERLPEEDGFYLVSLNIDTDINEIKVSRAWFLENTKVFSEYGKAVIAWMPLPNPYRLNREEHNGGNKD